MLRLLARGNTNLAIATALVVREGTVKYHVKNILRKLGATNRADAVARYVRAGGSADGPAEGRGDDRHASLASCSRARWTSSCRGAWPRRPPRPGRSGDAVELTLRRRGGRRSGRGRRGRGGRAAPMRSVTSSMRSPRG